MEWILLSGSILVAAYFIYSAIQRSNNLKEKQVEQKERELEHSPEYRYTQLKDQFDNSVAKLEDDVTKDEIELRKAQKEGDNEWVKEAKGSLSYSRRWLEIFKSARRKGLSDVK